MRDKKMDEADLNQILTTRHHNGADFWATLDGRIGIERPISTLTALLIMSELQVPKSHEAVKGAANLVMNACREDGRVRIAPKGAIYPCHTATAAAALCRNGYANDKLVKMMIDYLLMNRFEDGGWRCNKFSFGRGPETKYSNPGVTLFALDAFRYAGMNDGSQDLDQAVETLLNHWILRIPIGPCHYGIGNLFMQVEYPFLRYNLFYYTYVLSFYPKAQKDKRFAEAFAALSKKLDVQGRLIIERPNHKIAQLQLCRKDEPSAAATERYHEIVANINR